MKAKARVDRPHAIWTIPTTPKHRFHWGTNLKLATIPENSPMIWPRGALQSVETSIFHRTSSCGFPARYANRCHFSISDSICSRVNPTNVNSNRYSSNWTISKQFGVFWTRLVGLARGTCDSHLVSTVSSKTTGQLTKCQTFRKPARAC